VGARPPYSRPGYLESYSDVSDHCKRLEMPAHRAIVPPHFRSRAAGGVKAEQILEIRDSTSKFKQKKVRFA
jgi:hypothetical protein